VALARLAVCRGRENPLSRKTIGVEKNDLGKQLNRKYVCLLDLRRFREDIFSVCHQCCGDRPAKMSRLVGYLTACGGVEQLIKRAEPAIGQIGDITVGAIRRAVLLI
jgi:hypothetical protein